MWNCWWSAPTPNGSSATSTRARSSSVKPGLQAAFIDIGLERAGFLHASDLDHDDSEEEDESGKPQGRGRGRSRHVPDIGTVLKVGDPILVQVTKEPISTKGPRLTADISLPGRYLVTMPKGRHIGVSRKIEDRRERVRLKQLLQKHRPDEGAFIIRTAAVNVSEEGIHQDVDYLSDLFTKIDTASAAAVAPALVHEDVGMVVALIRDIFKEDTSRLVIDDRDDFARLSQYVKMFAPELKERIQLYKGDLPIFDEFEIEAEIKKTLDKRVWMKKGGYLIIEPTEALVSIDVNTGRFTGKRNQEDTILQTNMLAASEVARQLRLRDVGGIIVIDFIDMENESNKKRVFNELRNHLKRDRARHKVFQVSGPGPGGDEPPARAALAAEPALGPLPLLRGHRQGPLHGDACPATDRTPGPPHRHRHRREAPADPGQPGAGPLPAGGAARAVPRTVPLLRPGAERAGRCLPARGGLPHRQPGFRTRI